MFSGLYGIDYLGGAMYGGVLVRAHQAGFAAGFFAETFGNVWPVIDKLCATGRCPLVRVHGPWTAHKYIPAQHDKAIFAALEKTNRLSDKYPGIEFQFSPVCESDARGAAWQNLFKKCLHLARDIQIICSVYKGELIKGYTAEIHGNHAIPVGAYQHSDDGTSSVDANVQADNNKHSRAKVRFFWHPSLNLKYKTKLSGDEIPEVRKNDTSPPKQRWCKPNVEIILSLAALSVDKGAPKLKPRNLWKSHADRHATPPDPRAYKPVLISPVKANVVFLVNDAGQVVHQSTKREPYKDGRWRYYFSHYGYQIADKVLQVIADNTKVGSVNPAFREGDYRS